MSIREFITLLRIRKEERGDSLHANTDPTGKPVRLELVLERWLMVA